MDDTIATGGAIGVIAMGHCKKLESERTRVHAVDLKGGLTSHRDNLRRS